MTKRLSSVETLRVCAIFAVVLWHAGFVASLSELADGYFPVVLAGYLVYWVGAPYFFITAGYFFGQSLVAHGNLIAKFRRQVSPLLWIFLGWLCVYILVPPSWPAAILHDGLWQPFYTTALKHLHLVVTQNISLCLEGKSPVYHLWFLPALMFSLAVLTLLSIYRLQRFRIIIIVGLYVLALIEETVGGHFTNAAPHLGSWSVALLLTTIGWWLAERKQSTVGLAISLIVGGFAIAMTEGIVMNTILHSSLSAIKWHFFLGGIILSVGMFMLALAKPTLGQSTFFPFLARFTLGVYVSHILVLYTLSPLLWRVHIPLRGLFVGVVVYIFSVLLTMAVSRVPIISHFVMKSARHDVVDDTIKLQPNAHI